MRMKSNKAKSGHIIKVKKKVWFDPLFSSEGLSSINYFVKSWTNRTTHSQITFSRAISPSLHNLFRHLLTTAFLLCGIILCNTLTAFIRKVVTQPQTSATIQP